MIEAPWALVPIKETNRAKQRLSAMLTQDERQRLAVTMAEDVLAALAGTAELGGIAVVTEDPTIAEIATGHGAQILTEGARDGHSGAVHAGIRALVASGCRAVLTLPADVPLVTSGELASLIQTHGTGRGFTIAPAHDRRGSNGILCAPPDAVPLAFGDDSFLPHLSAARAADFEPKIVELPGLGLDVDHPRDMQAFLRRPSETRTWRLLTDWALRADGPSAAALQSAATP